MHKPKYRYNWKTGKPELLFRVEVKTEHGAYMEFLKNRRYVQSLFFGCMYQH